MRSAVHNSQEKKGVWITSNLFEQKVFIENLLKEQVQIYENPAFKEISGNKHDSEVPVPEALPQPISVEPTNVSNTVPTTSHVPPAVAPVRPSPQNEQNVTSSSPVVVVDNCTPVPSRSSSRTRELSSISNYKPKAGDKVLVIHPFKSSDEPSVQIKKDMVLEVVQVVAGNVLVDCNDWMMMMHWINKNDIKYLRKYH